MLHFVVSSFDDVRLYFLIRSASVFNFSRPRDAIITLQPIKIYYILLVPQNIINKLLNQAILQFFQMFEMIILPLGKIESNLILVVILDYG